jgi:hypothetical protein
MTIISVVRDSLGPWRHNHLVTTVVLGANKYFEQTVASMMMTESGTTLTQWTQDKVSESKDKFFIENLLLKGLAFGGGELAKKAADKVVPGSSKVVGPLVDEVISNLPELYKEYTETTVITTLSRNTLIEETDENTITQSFHVRDTDRPMSVDLYYDTLFGTFAFIPR